jgi:hypothetical protein
VKLLDSAGAIDKAVRREIDAGATIQGAVAWASHGFPTVELLLRSLHQVRRLVVGLHFFQTTPEFIRRTMAVGNIRFAKSTNGVFHPKAFLFTHPDRRWTALIGSANLTNGGFNLNEEVALFISDADPGGSEIRQDLESLLNRYWSEALRMSSEDLSGYEAMWTAKQPLLRRLSGTYGTAKGRRGSDGGRNPLQVPILRQTWGHYVKRVRKDPLLPQRLLVLEQVQRWLGEYGSFQALPEGVKKRVAGFVKPQGSEPDWRLFGSMKGAGRFMNIINSNHPGISTALDYIPQDGLVVEADFDRFASTFVSAFGDDGGDGIATATRLLAMKRPDHFVCVDSKNRKQLCADFGIPQNIGLAEYWASVCERIQGAAWWGITVPAEKNEHALWRSRAALLDSVYYDPGNVVHA